MYRSLKQVVLDTEEQVRRSLKKVDWQRISKLNEDFLKLITSPQVWQQHARCLTCNLEKGEILIEFRPPVHPATLKSIWKPTRQVTRPSYNSIKDKMAVIQSALSSEWLPPFSAQAMLIGGQHYITFDGKAFDFAGSSCSYVLAKNPKNPNFEVLIKYRGVDSYGQIQKSILVKQHSREIELLPQEKNVKLDNNVVELPIVLEGGLTVRRENQAFVLQSSHGIRVEANLKKDIVTMTLNRWQFNKYFGLFGSYDHEATNDFRTPEGHLVSRVKEFAQSWKSGYCRYHQNLAHNQMARPESTAFQLCQQHFVDESRSTLRGAFSLIEPKPFFELCLRHTAKQEYEPRKGLCEVAAGYLKKAHFFGIELHLPTECLTCDSMEFGQRSRHYPSYSDRKADVVFVVEEDSCNIHLAKQMDSLASHLERDFRQEAFVDTKFGLVSFGEESEETIRTARGETMFPAKDILLALEGMRFDSGRGGSKKQVDNMEALLIAAEYGWRKSASRNLILITCNACEMNDYSMVQHMLLEKGISLHVVNEAHIQSKKESLQVFGVDAKRVYNSKSLEGRSLNGDQELRYQVDVRPKDVCVALAQETGGSFFTSRILRYGRGQVEKQWRSLFSRRVVQSAEPDQCQRCDCALDSDKLSSRTICRPCRPWKPVY